MNNPLPTEFNRYSPDELRELYERDPELFNALAAAAINQACIGSTPEQTRRLRQTQWLIDGQLMKARTPLHRMQIMENIFYSRVFGENGDLQRLNHGLKDLLDALGGIDRLPVRKSGMYLLKNAGLPARPVKKRGGLG